MLEGKQGGCRRERIGKQVRTHLGKAWEIVKGDVKGNHVDRMGKLKEMLEETRGKTKCQGSG